MKNKAYDIEFWRKPGETDAETRERLYRQCKTDKMYFGFENLVTVFDEATNAFWDCVKAVAYLLIAVHIVFFAAPYYIGRAVIIRYLILKRIGVITWYGKRIKN